MKICIDCHSEADEIWRERCIKCYSKWYYQNNREKIIQKSYKWMYENRERFRINQRKVKDRARAKISPEEKRTEWLNRQAVMSDQEKQNRRDRSKRYYYENIEARRQYGKEYREKNKDKVDAEHAVWYAIKKGKMPHISTQSCYLCGTEAKNYHHWSYKPEHRLDVIPLCKSCHGKVHRNLVSLLIYSTQSLQPKTIKAKPAKRPQPAHTSTG